MNIRRRHTRNARKRTRWRFLSGDGYHFCPSLLPRNRGTWFSNGKKDNRMKISLSSAGPDRTRKSSNCICTSARSNYSVGDTTGPGLFLGPRQTSVSHCVHQLDVTSRSV